MLAALLILAPVGADATADEQRFAPEQYASVNASLIDTHVLPRYAHLSAATKAFAVAAKNLCARTNRSGWEQAQERFHDAMETWMAVQHLRFGPVELFMRADRFYFWPQARGKVAEALRTFIAGGEDAAFPAARIEQANVAVQGLLAAEALLYRTGPPESGTARCQLLEAVALNMRDMAGEIVADWTQGEHPFARLLKEPGPQNPYFQEHREVTLEFFRSIHDTLQLLAVVKLRSVAGDSIQAARPRMVESRLSARSLHNVIGNLEALRALYDGEGGSGLGDLAAISDPKLDRLMRKAFRLTIATARSIDRPLEQAAVNPALRPRVEKLTIQVRALRQIVKDRLAPALALSAGFNALDGD